MSDILYYEEVLHEYTREICVYIIIVFALFLDLNQ